MRIIIRFWLPAIKRGRFLALLVIVVTLLRTIVYVVHMPLKFSGLNGDWNHDLVDAGAVLNQLSYQANSELVVMRFDDEPRHDVINT